VIRLDYKSNVKKVYTNYNHTVVSTNHTILFLPLLLKLIPYLAVNKVFNGRETNRSQVAELVDAN